jgi:chemotaxis family two-component system response regulator Rcp1
VLVVEDNRADVFLIREALSTTLQPEITVASDGEKAIQFLDELATGETLCPDLIIVDINLPKKHGGQVLAHLRSGNCRAAAVLVVTSSNSAEDREAMMRSGADAYFRKPSEYDEYMKLGEVARRLLAARGES